MTKHEEDPLKISTTAQKLLDNGDVDMAATYFWFAAEKFVSAEKWSDAGQNYEKTGYCYDLEGLWEKAKEAYHKAGEMYKKIGQLAQAALMQSQVKIIEKNMVKY
jgi:tetratricopeptide (TPR) repeat protein